MMNRNVRESLAGGRNFPMGSQHRRGQSLNLAPKDSDDGGLDLFSKSRRTLSVTSSDESSDVSVKLGRLSVGSAKVGRTGIDDLLSSTDGGKHDYDWLLTPPETPLFASSDGSESQPSLAPPRKSLSRPSSAAKPSRLSVSQSESNHSSRPARSSSVTRSSTSASLYNNYSSNRSSNILNTSSASVSSYPRPSSPITRSPSTARPSTPTSRPALSRSTTPSRARTVSTTSSIEKPRPVQGSSRPSTPSSSRPQIPANLNSSHGSRPNSRPSTPTRRSSLPSLSPASSPSPSVGRGVLSNGRSSAPSSRPSSPSPRVRPPPQPIVPPDFPLDTPPNLRTTLPDRPISAGRSRPGTASTMKGKPEPPAPTIVPRRQSSPIVSRGRLTETPSRGRVHSNGHLPDVHEPPRKSTNIPDMGMRKPVKSSTPPADSTGFGRSISKKSLDMAIRHMDIRNGSANARQLSGSTLFPQSIRSSTSAPKAQSVCALSTPASAHINGSHQTNSNGFVSENGHIMNRHVENGNEADSRRYSAKLSEVDIYESSRYDAILLKEDMKNTNWLHSLDDKLDQGPIFDNGFEHLPEPFGLL
ncbi:DNA-directed RNA polymerase II subunit RPB1-like [Pyrus ussuriensis x Pyrus communis]|uniref:DNA-directed RNA polymerase II subunit RPB1-like n=1 Tax=Pyrus ussuriensis x Pyrus communis TaxID=2448454 RepID=A0A5N5H8P7_9ROSA|nr:DNA-directed RNA polymerase II subunit RPB1-like [Pyrus ussuriensis x Pyrus communis]